jgi:hypothetical protein
MSDARLRIGRANPTYTDAVLADIDRIRRTAAGVKLFRALSDAERSVIVERPDPPTDPPNAWTRFTHANDRGDADIVIAYDPIDWPSPLRSGNLPSDVVLFGLFQDTLGLAGGSEELTDVTMDAYLLQRTAIPDPPPKVRR